MGSCLMNLDFIEAMQRNSRILYNKRNTYDITNCTLKVKMENFIYVIFFIYNKNKSKNNY